MFGRWRSVVTLPGRMLFVDAAPAASSSVLHFSILLLVRKLLCFPIETQFSLERSTNVLIWIWSVLNKEGFSNRELSAVDGDTCSDLESASPRRSDIQNVLSGL